MVHDISNKTHFINIKSVVTTFTIPLLIIIIEYGTNVYFCGSESLIFIKKVTVYRPFIVFVKG